MYSGPITDTHAHLYPRNYLKKLEERVQYPVFRIGADGRGYIHFNDTSRTAPISEAFVSPDLRIKEMNRFGISTELLSSTNPWTDLFPSVELTCSIAESLTTKQALL